MKKSLLILFAAVAVTSAASSRYPADLGQRIFSHLFDLSEVESDVEFDGASNSNTEIDKFGWILNGEGKKAVKGVLEQMPCGWPDSGIPPLAPYRKEEAEIHIKKAFIETFSKLIRFRIDGLDDMKINKLSISYTFSQKVKYNFTFPKITISGKYITDTLMNLLEEYGLHIRLVGDDDFEIVLENLTLIGQFKYKMPIIFGSIRIYKFSCTVTLGNCASRINGLLGKGKLNTLINDKIEEIVLWSINGNQQRISAKIEETFVPTVNDALKGKNIWSLLGGSSGTTCVPPPDPWA